MTTSILSHAYPRRVLADTLPFPRSRMASLATSAVLVAAGAALVAVAAQIVVPFWPVPLTMQTFAVLLVGTSLGPLRGALSLTLYLVIGVAGAPIFAGGASGSLFALTTGGYIIGFIAAAGIVGALARRSWDRHVAGMLVSFIAGSAIIYAFGLLWLHFSLQGLGQEVWGGKLGFDSLLAATLGAGLLPFVIGDLAKALLAGSLVPLVWRGVRAIERSAER